MKCDELVSGFSMIIVDVCGRDRAFSNEPLSNKELLAIRERILTLIALNLRGVHVQNDT
jgi:hypothetical protein